MQQEPSKTKITISSILLGFGLGVLMAVLFLYVLKEEAYRYDYTTLAFLYAIAIAFPVCFYGFAKKGLSLKIIVGLGIAVSFMICISFVKDVSATPSTRDELNTVFLQLHGVALAYQVFMMWFHKKRRKDSK